MLVNTSMKDPESYLYYTGRQIIPDNESRVIVYIPRYKVNFSCEISINITQVHKRGFDIQDIRSFSCSDIDNDGTFEVISNKKGGEFSWLVIGKISNCEVKQLKSDTGPYTFIDQNDRIF